MTFDPLIRVLQEKFGAQAKPATKRGRILERRPMGLYLVDAGTETKFMTSLTDELLRVDDLVWIIDTEEGPRILGAVK